MAKKIHFLSRWDNNSIDLNITGDFATWKEGKCWSAFCSNPIVYIHFSENGNATHGYCNDTYMAMKYATMLRKEHVRGKWFLFVKGKLFEDKEWARYNKSLQKRGSKI